MDRTKVPKNDMDMRLVAKKVSTTSKELQPRPKNTQNLLGQENKGDFLKASKKKIAHVYHQKDVAAPGKRRAFVDLTNALDAPNHRLTKGKRNGEGFDLAGMPLKQQKKAMSLPIYMESDKNFVASIGVRKNTGLKKKPGSVKNDAEGVKGVCRSIEQPNSTKCLPKPSATCSEHVFTSRDTIESEVLNIPPVADTLDIMDYESVKTVPGTISNDHGMPCTQFKHVEAPKNLTLPCSHSEQVTTIRNVDADPDPNVVSEYAESIFTNMRKREMKFLVGGYLDVDGCQLNGAMRSILVDWLVEVQENFELYHETLYLAVKLVDRFLQVSLVPKEQLQLVGAAALMIACKIEERHPPPIEDFVFICDDAYAHCDFVGMEMKIFRALDFDMQTPIPYAFLRRYARVAGASIEVLTLSRYILETSLLEYAMVSQRPSHMAAACLNLAFRMKAVGEWDSTLEHHTGYKEDDILETMRTLNEMIKSAPKNKLQTVRSKYSHPVFYTVAIIPPLDSL